MRYTGQLVAKVAHRTAHSRTGAELFLHFTGNLVVKVFVIESVTVKLGIQDAYLKGH